MTMQMGLGLKTIGAALAFPRLKIIKPSMNEEGSPANGQVTNTVSTTFFFAISQYIHLLTK